MAKSRTPDTSVVLSQGCNLACPVCDCRAKPPSQADQQRLICRGGSYIEFRGEAALQPDIFSAVSKARSSGWSNITVRTNGIAYTTAARARELVRGGVSGVVFFITSDRPAVHDAITRQRGAFQAALAGLAELAAAGLEISAEVPVLSSSLQDITALLNRLLTIAPIYRLRLYSPPAWRSVDGRVPKELIPPTWAQIRPSLVNSLRYTKERGIECTFTEREGVPLCAFASADDEGHLVPNEEWLADRGNRSIPRTVTSGLGPNCDQCPAAKACPGTTKLYLDRYGQTGLTLLTRAPSRKKEVLWTETRKKAAQNAFSVVLRPTVNCNQDCWFCSANETSRNVEEDPDQMVRRIARVVRTGVSWVSFSGGEPTLSKHLVDYVSVAKRAGADIIELVTNGVLLEKEEKANQLVNAGVTNLFVSLHAHNESLSQLETRKIGDHTKTVKALHNLEKFDHIRLDVNHVVSVHNYRSLVRFIDWLHGEFGTRIGVSFAYVTPQYKALDRLSDLVPRYREVMPYLKRALARAVELQMKVTVGSRQGVPPCLLEEFLPFSDILSTVSGALTEDASQKTQAPQCADCRLRNVCTGLWKPYASLYGTDELKPLLGDPITPEEAAALTSPDAVPPNEIPEVLRFGSDTFPSSASIELPANQPQSLHLPVLNKAPNRVLRVGVVGSGTRALMILRSLLKNNRYEVLAMASPHAPEKDLPEIPNQITRHHDIEELFRYNLDALIVATSTRSHIEIAKTVLARQLFCLVEKPIAATAAEAEELLKTEYFQKLCVLQQLRTTGGAIELQAIIEEKKSATSVESIEVIQRTPPNSAAAIHTWSRAAFFEVLVHLGDLCAALAKDHFEIIKTTAWGGGHPERLLIQMASSGRDKISARIELDLKSTFSATIVRVNFTDGSCANWTRKNDLDEVEVITGQGSRIRTPKRGGDLEHLLNAWHQSIVEDTAPPVSLHDAIAAVRMSTDMVRLLETSGASFDRIGGPIRVASLPLRDPHK